MAENEEVIKSPPLQRSSFSETEHTERRRPGPKSRKTRIPPRRPTQRHCPKTNNRKSITKRRKRLLSTSDPSNQEPESPKVSDSSLSQTSTSSSLSPVSPVPSNSTGKKRRYAIDKCDGRGETHLHKAAIKGDIKKVKHLLRRGANPNHQDFAGWTPLHEACIRGWYHVAQALLKAGADVNTPGLHNVTALHDATAWSHLSLVKLLLKYGAKINAKTDKGDTPVEVASAVVLDYLESHGLIPESAKARAVPERTYEMRKSTYRSKVVKADSADIQFKIKVRCEQTGEDRDAIKHNKKGKKKPASLNHSKTKMESDEVKKESAASSPSDTKETTETKPSSSSSGSASSSAAAEGSEAASSTLAASSTTTTETVSETESRRSSISLDDEDEGKRIKRRKEKDEHARKEDSRVKEDHKKDEYASKKEEHNHKKEEHNTAGKGKSSSTNSASPKSTTSLDGQDGEDCSKSIGSPGPKVPPLKIVIPPVETEQGSRNGKNTGRHHPYVVVSNDETGTASSTVTTSPSSPAVPPPMIKEGPPSPMSGNTLSNDEQRIQQRVLRSTHSSNRTTTGNNSSTNSTSSGSNSSTTSGNSSPAAPDLSPQTDMTTPSKEETKTVKIEPGIKGSKSVDSSSKSKVEPTIKMEPADEESTAKAGSSETRSAVSYHKEETNTVELHPRKRKLKSKQESTHMEVDNVPSFSSAPHPHEVPVTNCYQMYMDIRKQIDVKRKRLFPIQPKPPQGFKDYLMNRCTYTLAGNTVGRAKRRSADPPDIIPEGLKELYKEQEAERQKMRMQHIVEKEKLVLSVEQEILRVHGRAARALANQALPFSACTILKDEEVYNVITPEQEEKDRNARSRYNGRLFISWLQDVDDKWEKIKEEMLARHHKEAESLNAIQKFKWDLKMRILGLCKSRSFAVVDEISVPMIKVSDDFDLLPE